MTTQDHFISVMSKDLYLLYHFYYFWYPVMYNKVKKTQPY